MAEMLVEGTNANAIPKTVIPPPINPDMIVIYLLRKNPPLFHKSHGL